MKDKITLSSLERMKSAGEKIAVLTAYDAGFARLAEAAGVEVILVGDSLGMVVQGHDSTLPVTVQEMVYHTAMVNRGCHRPLLVADMPFMSHGTPRQALDNAGRLMKEGGAHMVKLEGGHAQVETVRHLTDRAVPVCAHLGLLPSPFTSWAVTRCRAGTATAPSVSSTRLMSCRKQAPRCWCWNVCRNCWQQKSASHWIYL